MEILIYVRPTMKKFMHQVATMTFGDSRIVSLGDRRNLGDLWDGDFIYNTKLDYDNPDYEEVSTEIIARCKILRNMKKETARLVSRRYWNGIDEFLTKNAFDYAIILPVDCYCLDVLERVAIKHNICTIAFVQTFISGYAKIATRGEDRKISRIIEDAEVERVLDELTKSNYLPQSEAKNVKQCRMSVYKFFYRRKLIENVYYPLMKVIYRDKWNWQFNIFLFRGKKLKSYYNNNYDSIFLHLEDIKIDAKNSVYLPLHKVPEDTTDYWTSDYKEANYEDYIINLIDQSDKNVIFLIKEHPAMYGKRDIIFYDKLKLYNNVLLIHPMDRSNKLLEMVETVVVDNGTVGVEALLRGKRLLVLSKNYYSHFHSNSFYVQYIDKNDLSRNISNANNKEFIRRILESTFQSDFINSRQCVPKSNPNSISEGIKMYLEKCSKHDD